MGFEYLLKINKNYRINKKEDIYDWLFILLI